MSLSLLTWNVQWCRGMDGRVDPARIADYVRQHDVDVACFQEIASNFQDLPGSPGEDQPSALARELPGYEPAVAWAVDAPGTSGGRARFGNMILSRLPLERIRRHSLPWPDSPDTPSMPRVAVDVVVQTSFGAVRVLTTHLEYYDASHRAAQLSKLRDVLREGAAARYHEPQSGPFRPCLTAPDAIVCGDFNMPPADPLHAEFLGAGLVDGWQHVNGDTPHPPTFRLDDGSDVPPYCCDFVYVTKTLAPRLQAIRIDGDTRASDHQPVLIELR
jgi:endonuclease/exonuclease/phosphatase family metal-dependent hydrolase